MSAIDSQLIACAGDIGYELKMIGALGQLKTPRDLPFVGYGLLESLLVHVRLLDDFLANRCRVGRAGDDDLTARDYNSSWSSNGFLRAEERSSINKKVVHLTRSRRDHTVDRQWRTAGTLDPEGRWHRIDLAERALAAFTEFSQTLDPDTKELFQKALMEAWSYYLSALEVNGRLQNPRLAVDRASVLDNRVTVWCGTSPLVVHELVDGDPLEE